MNEREKILLEALRSVSQMSVDENGPVNALDIKAYVDHILFLLGEDNGI